MKLYIAGDHAGFKLKEKLKKYLGNRYIVVDFGAKDYDKDDDYPDFAKKLAEKLGKGRGILVCGSGQGVCIAANKFRGVRAAQCWNIKTARHAKEHLDANVICLGARTMRVAMARKVVDAWLGARFLKGRHLRRIRKIRGLEK